MVAFDPDAAAQPGSGLFGLQCTEDESECVLVPVPFDATTSYRDGARHGREAIHQRSGDSEITTQLVVQAPSRPLHFSK